MTLAAGTRLGPYQISEQLGAGGMGEVYRARDTRLDRSVAIKVLPRHLSDRPDLRERFEREARTISSLNHPNICTLHDIGRQDGVDFLVMEYLEGETLAARLAKGALPLEEALEVALQMADALDKAHRQGVVHRDLKPGNIMLTKSGAKLLDFGLAKQAQPAASPAGQSAAPTNENPLTLQGTILGTLQYMSPEQLEGKDADPRTDIFAFGAVIHEMVTGRKAFDGKSQVSLIAAIVDHDPPPISSVKPVSPPLLDHLVKVCLVKNPDKRWQTMADVLIQLRLIVDSGVELAAPAAGGRTKRHLRAAWGTAAVLFLAAGALALLLVFGGTSPEAAKISFEIPTPSAPSPLHNSMSPSGSHIAAIVTSDKGAVLWVRPLERLNAQTVAGTENVLFPFWSPDGRFIGFFADGKLKKVDLLGAPPQTLSDAAAGHGGTWSQDDVIVLAPTASGPLFRVSAAGGAATQLTELDKSREETAHRHPQFLPDNKHFIYVAVSNKPENSGVHAASLDSKERKFLVNTPYKAMFAAPEHLLFTRENTLMAQRFDPVRLELAGEPFPIAEGVGINITNSAAGFTVSNNGILAYRTGGLGTASYLMWFDRSGKNIETVGAPAGYQNHVLSPDLQRLAVARAESGPSDIWIVDLVRGPITRFTFDSGIDNAPLWSPDGTRIVFSTNRGNAAFDLYQKSASGVGQEELLFKSDHPKVPEHWSGDGRFLLYRDIDPQTREDLWVLPMMGDKKPEPVVRSPFREFQGRFSPDGRWIAYVSNESNQDQVYVQGFPTASSRTQISTTGGFQPRWRRDGKELLFISQAREVMAVDIGVSADGALKIGVPRKLFSATPITVTSYRNSWEMTPDAQRFLINSSQQQATSSLPITVVVNWLSSVTTKN